MKITAQDLLALHVIDAIVPEPEGGAHTDVETIIAAAGDMIRRQLVDLLQLDLPTLLDQRYAKYRAIGHYQERQSQILGHTNGDGGASFLLPFA
jgi:acetyl-CoA carboxylase carboxyl transferase subunit alpha